MNRLMAIVLMLHFLAIAFPLQTLAGPNAGGILAVHDSNLAYSAETAAS